MNCLFFDIECVYHQNEQYILSFGYVKTDMNFNIIKKEDILINPNLSFSLADVGVPVYYSIKEILNSPIFPDVYPRIKAILEEKDQIVIGHAVINDVEYLVSECESYELDGFNFTFHDAQLMFSQLYNEPRRVSLDNILLHFGIAKNNLHRSDEDALHTMYYVKAMCEKNELGLPELLERSGSVEGEIDSLKLREPFIRYWIYRSCSNTDYKQIALRIGCGYLEGSPEGKLKGKKIGINSHVLYDDLNYSLYLLSLIVKEGGKFAFYGQDFDYFIYDYNDCPVQTNLSVNETWQGQFLDLDEFCQLLKVSRNEVEEKGKDFFEKEILPLILKAR